MSIRYEYDLKSEKILPPDIIPGVHTDQCYAIEHIRQVSESDLVIQDLGYFSTEIPESISRKKAFFVSRLHPAVPVFTAQGKPLCFKKSDRQMQRSGIGQKELSVTFGRKAKIPVRLPAQRLSDGVYNQRIRERKKENCRKGQGAMSDQTGLRLRFHPMITNVCEKDLPGEHAYGSVERWPHFAITKISRQVFVLYAIHTTFVRSIFLRSTIIPDYR
jgi:hypothetical protein